MGTQREIPTELIQANPVALRGVDRDDENYQSIVESVKHRGVLLPIVVREIKEGTNTVYQLIDGLQRYSAAVESGLSSIPCNIIDADEAETLEIQIIANAARVETRPAAYAKQLQRLMALKPATTLSELAANISRSTTWVAQRLKLVRLAPAVAKLVDAGQIAVSNAVILANLPAEEQPNYVDQAVSMSVEEFAPTIQTRLKEIRTALKEGRAAGEPEFCAKATMRKLSELKFYLDDDKNIKTLADTLKVKPLMAKAVLQWALHLDEAGIALQKAKFDANKQKVAAAKAMRKAAVAEKKRQQAEIAAKEAQEATVSVG